MPTVTATSPVTGETHEIEFSGDPTEADIEAAVQHADAPIVAVQRRAMNARMEGLLGGVPVNPETDLPSYSDEQRKADANLIQRSMIEQDIQKAQQESAQQDQIARAGKLESALSGIVSIPTGLASLGASALQGIVKKINPGAENDPRLAALMSTLPQQAVEEQIIGRAAQNPASGALGMALAQGGTMGVGGIPANLARGAFKEAGTQLLTAAPINAAIGTGIRTATGQGTSVSDLATDVAFAGLGGKNPRLNEAMGSTIEAAAKPFAKIADLPGVAIESLRGTRDPFELITKGLKPANKIGLAWNKERITPALQTMKDVGSIDPSAPIVIENVPTFVDAAKTSKQRLYGTIKEVTGNPNAVDVDGAPIVDRVLNAIANDKTLAERPQEVKALMDEMAVYNRPIPLDEAERLLTQTNEELFGPLFNRTVEGKKIAGADLQVKQQKALASALSEQINAALEEQLGAKGAKIKQEYGAISQMQREAEKRYLVSLRQAQESLPQQLAYAQSASDIVEGLATIATGGKFALGKFAASGIRKIAADKLRELNSTDSLIKRTFENLPSGKSPYISTSYPVIPPSPTYSPADIQYAIEQRKQRMQPVQVAPAP